MQVKLAKDLVTYLKTGGISPLLDKRVVQEAETRWNSLSFMLESVCKQFDKVIVNIT